MNCLIVAAGHGSRLRTVSDSKPLTPVAGTPLIEHVVTAAAAAGASRFVVVTGHQADRLEVFLASLPARLGIAVEWVRTADWSRPNGHSVLSGAARIDGDYLLTMSDHLFDPEIARRLLRAPRGEAGLILAVDRDLRSPLIDMDDATKVETNGKGAIVRIGKTLARFDAIDTGLFLATPALAEALRAGIDAGGTGSISEGVQRLADRGRAHVLDVTGRRWLDVDDPRSLGLAQAFVGDTGFRDSAS